MVVVDLGTISFHDACREQELAVRGISQGLRPETLFLLEHPHVFTVGRTGSEANLLTLQGWDGDPVECVRINRGGDVTYHGPGQLVGYPHLDLKRRGVDLHRFLRNLEEVIIQSVGRFGVSGFRKEGLTGVWTARGKLASIGVGVRQWVTMHGFALNVSTDLRYFEMINPCGMPGCPVTSMTELLGQKVGISEVKKVIQEVFSEVFGEAEVRT